MRRLSHVNRLRDYCERLFAPETDWIQVEVTSYCNAFCTYCPRTVYRDTWINRHMPLETFKRLLPAIANTELLFLQGWGEPFLNPDIFDMINLAKETGCRVGTTSNGMLLDDRRIKQLVECGLDIISFSVAGLDDRNELLREGTSLGTILDAIKKLNREKINQGLNKPAIHVSYLLLNSGLRNLARLPDILSGLGIDLIVMSALDFVPTKTLEDEALRMGNRAEFNGLCSFLNNIKTDAENRGLCVHFNFDMEDKPCDICSENPQRSFYVSADGFISSCVFTNLPVTSADYYYQGQRLPYKRLTFGNISNQSISAIWRQKEYYAFRRSFNTGRLNPVCKNCHKMKTSCQKCS